MSLRVAEFPSWINRSGYQAIPDFVKLCSRKMTVRLAQDIS